MPSITVEPCTFALFGALGDLALRKLFPALYQLAVNMCQVRGGVARLASQCENARIGMQQAGTVQLVGARAFGYFALLKVTRRKAATLSGRYRSNG